MREEPPFISVIVPHLNQPMCLAECLSSLEAQRYPRHRFEVIVVDNGSTTTPDAIVASCPGARLELERERGAGPARNRGMAIARGSVFAFLDADCVADPAWLVSGANALRTADLVGGRIRVVPQDDAEPTPVERFEMMFAFHQEAYIRRKGFAVTANLFAKREVYSLINGFRNGVSEDQDWCERAVARGKRLAYAADAVVTHPARRTLAELKAKWERIIREHFRLHAEKHGSSSRWVAYALAVGLSIFPHALRILFGSLNASLRERASVILVLVQLRAWRARMMLMLAMPRAASRS